MRAGGAALAALCLGAAAFLGSCGSAAAQVEVLLGNASFGAGDYDAAIASYLRAAAAGADPATVKYDLGVAYLAAGEGEGAAAALASLADELRPDPARAALRYLASYGAGCALLSLERYGEAWARFKQALELDPASAPAKRNLEIAARLLAKREEGSPPAFEPLGEAPPGTDGAIDFVRKKEKQQWESRKLGWQAEGADDW